MPCSVVPPGLQTRPSVHTPPSSLNRNNREPSKQTRLLIEKFQPICPKSKLRDLLSLVESKASNPDAIEETIARWWEEDNKPKGASTRGGAKTASAKKEEEEWTECNTSRKKKPVQTQQKPVSNGGARSSGPRGAAPGAGAGGFRGEGRRGEGGRRDERRDVRSGAPRGPNSGRAPAGE